MSARIQAEHGRWPCVAHAVREIEAQSGAVAHPAFKKPGNRRASYFRKRVDHEQIYPVVEPDSGCYARPDGMRRTPAPTIDVASLPLADLQATATALATELALAESRAAGASSAGEESAADQDIRRVEGQIDTLNELIAAAGGSEGGEAAPAEEVTLALVGAFDEARDWGWAEIEALGTMTATVAGPRNDDPEAEYTGVSLTALLEAAGLSEDATTLVSTAADGFSAESDLTAIKDCAECMLVLEEGSLRLIMPGFASREWVRDLVSLEAK